MDQFFRISLLYILALIRIETIISQSQLYSIDVSNKIIGPMTPIWAYFGYDEANYTTMKDGKKLLSELSALSPVPVYIRTHNLLTSGDGKASLKWSSTNAYSEDSIGNPFYNWTIIDSIFDELVKRKMKPLVEIGFMPKALSVKPEPYRHDWPKTFATGWAYPPKDYYKWSELIFQWVTHCISRYGKVEVETWLWEVWNEPNIMYWQGTLEEYFKLYDFAANGLKRACLNAKIGGPHCTGPSWNKSAEFLTLFLNHCLTGINYATGKTGSPLDYIGFHAKGSVSLEANDKHIRMSIGNQLRDIDAGFKIVASFPQLKNKPIILGESDPDACAACSAQSFPQYAYRNGTVFSCYVAAAFARTYALADFYNVKLLGAVTWSFEFEDQPYFAGFRDLATNGIDKPVLNVFRMFGMMKGNRVAISVNPSIEFSIVRDSSIRKKPDVNALACRDTNSVSVMIWNYHDDNLPANDALIELKIKDLPNQKINIKQYRIDKEFSSSYEVWENMGSPQKPTREQYMKLQDAGQLKLYENPTSEIPENNELILKTNLPRHAVSLFQLTW